MARTKRIKLPKNMGLVPSSYLPTQESLKEGFKNDYEFKKPIDPTSPLQGFEHRYRTSEANQDYMTKTEYNMLTKKPSGYCAHEGKLNTKRGDLRLSGNPKAHRIGARKKK